MQENIDKGDIEDINERFEGIGKKASVIEDWINNLSLLNRETVITDMRGPVEISMMSDENTQSDLGRSKVVEKQLENISQIANFSKLISV